MHSTRRASYKARYMHQNVPLGINGVLFPHPVCYERKHSLCYNWFAPQVPSKWSADPVWPPRAPCKELVWH